MDQRSNIGTNSILIFIWGFICAVLVSSFISISPLVSIFLIFVGVTILFAEKVYKKELLKETIFIFVALISFGLGILCYDIKDFHESITPSVTGIVISEPEQKENTTRFTFLADNGEKVLVNTDLYSEVSYGDRVEVKGLFKVPTIIDDGVGRPFDYPKYLSKDDIYFVTNFAQVEIISSGHGNFLKQALFSLKHSVVNKIRNIFAEPESSLFAGLILAGKSVMPENILEEFRRAGIIHIVVLSGYNITVIADFMRVLFRSAKFSVIGVLFFVIMTGAQATVVRAAIMVLTVILAKALRRNFSAPRALLAAGFLMVVQNPKILVFDPSFQLSFLATCALIYVAPIAERYLSRGILLKWEKLRGVLSTTISTQIVVLPLLVYSMGEVSLVSLLSNILILLFIPTVMLTGFLAIMLAYISKTIALPLTYFSHLILFWILAVAHFLGNLSFATISTPQLSVWIIAAVYIVGIIFIRRLRNSSHTSASLS